MRFKSIIGSIFLFFLLIGILNTGSLTPATNHSTSTVHVTSLPPVNTRAPAKTPNIILMIGDGMGIDEVTAASLVEYGVLNGTIMDSFPNHSLYNTTNKFGLITDSAASGTAIATGELTANNRISMDSTASISLKTILEYLKYDLNYSTGLVTTTRLSHATPAVFAAHNRDRHNEHEIIPQILNQGIDILLGGGLNGLYWGSASKVQALGAKYGYDVATTRNDLMLLRNTTNKLLGVFPNEDYLPYELDRNTTLVPGIQDLTDVALTYLDSKNKPFFVMIEGGRIDHAGHAGASGDPNADTYMVTETIYYEKAVRQAYEYARTHENTIVISIADHETGGFTIHNFNATSLGNELPHQGLTRAENNTLRIARTKQLNATFDASYHTARLVRFDAYGFDFSNITITRVNDVFWAMNYALGSFPTSHRVSYEKTESTLTVTPTIIDKDNSTGHLSVFIDYENPQLTDTITTIAINMTQPTSTFTINAPALMQENFTWFLVYHDSQSFNTTSFPYKNTYIIPSSTTQLTTNTTTTLIPNTTLITSTTNSSTISNTSPLPVTFLPSLFLILTITNFYYRKYRTPKNFESK